MYQTTAKDLNDLTTQIFQKASNFFKNYVNNIVIIIDITKNRWI